MRFLKIITASLILLNIPSVVLRSYGATLGSLLSYSTILLLLFYYFFTSKKTSLNGWMIILAITYFTISSFQYIGEAKFFIFDAVKYFIVIICGYELIKELTIKEVYFILLFGTITIALEALFLPSKWGRYSGFYLNPNVAGFICIYGYALTYGIKKQSLQLIGQFIFTLMGLLTFSRTFIVIWICLNIISLKISIKNIKILGLGFLIISSLFLIDELVGLNNPRFDQMKKFANNEQVDSNQINEDSRADTWALFYDEILKSPLIGNGYGTFSGKTRLGAHNSYLMIVGEAGIIPFFIMLILIGYMFYWGIFLFEDAPNIIMQTIALSLFLLANHNFFVFYYITFSTMLIQYQISKQKKINLLKNI